jgi:hypothetical protein
MCELVWGELGTFVKKSKGGMICEGVAEKGIRESSLFKKTYSSKSRRPGTSSLFARKHTAS